VSIALWLVPASLLAAGTAVAVMAHHLAVEVGAFRQELALWGELRPALAALEAEMGAAGASLQEMGLR